MTPMKPQTEAAPYIDVLERLHRSLRPKSYLEIGTLSGTSLRLARCASIAIDPRFALDKDVLADKPSCQFFQMTSDEFFAQHSPTTLLGRPVDMAFLDGMHYAEFLLRDFINTERHARRNSLIVLHDCVPANIEMTTRQLIPGAAWTGDVWKVVPMLKKYRPELVLHALNAPPTGLIVCTNLNPGSRILEDRYFAILEEFSAMDLGKMGLQAFRDIIGLTGTEMTATPEAIAEHYWL